MLRVRVSLGVRKSFYGGMVDTLVSKASAERRFGSSPNRSTICSGGGIGRLAGLKIQWPDGREGSSPSRSTKSVN